MRTIKKKWKVSKNCRQSTKNPTMYFENTTEVVVMFILFYKKKCIS